MPTGYADAIKDGISFENYALNCSKAFGACVTMRDDPMDTPIPKRFEPSNYHIEELEEAKKELLELASKSDDEILVEIEEGHEKSLSCAKKRAKESQDLRQKYEKMLTRVKNWQPPTSDHVNFKNFMISQIEDRIKFDCSENFYAENLGKKKPTIEEYKSKKITQLNEDIIYHQKEHNEEVERVESRNKWLDDLRQSLKQ